jgi:hypothetical protein
VKRADLEHLLRAVDPTQVNPVALARAGAWLQCITDHLTGDT